MPRLVPIQRIQRVLIVRPDAIGDMVLTVPCIRAIKAAYPHWHITVLASPYNSRIVRHIPEIDDILLDWKRNGKINSFWDKLHFIRYLRSRKFDLAIHFYSETETVWPCVFAGIPYHIGDTAKIGLWPVFRKYGTFLKTFDQTKHVVEYNFQLLRALGISLDPESKIDIPLPPGESERAELLLTQEGRRSGVPLIGIQIGVGYGNRPIEPEKYAEYINALRQKTDLDVWVSPYSEKEKVFTARFLSHLNGPALVIPDTPITTLMGLISHSDVFVSVDTGPFHLGVGLGVPMLAIFPSRKVKPTRWAPWRNRHFVVRESQTCSYFCPHEGCVRTICSDNIRVTDMVDKTLALLDGKGVQSASDQFNLWFRASMSVLLLEDIQSTYLASQFEHELKTQGIRVIRRDVLAPNLFEALVENDVTIIHNFSRKRRFYVALRARLVSLKLFNPPVVINQIWTVKHPDSIPNRYRRAFEEKHV